MLTRRTFLKTTAGLGGVGALAALPSCGDTPPSPLPQPAKATTPLINHLGFAPGAMKFCVDPAGKAGQFEVVEATSGRVVHEGMLQPKAGDLGSYAVGEFTDLSQEGSYLLEAGGQTTAFAVGRDIYLPVIRTCIDYFAKQRCGDSQTGFHAPCHLDDGKRLDDGTQLDTTGGWHDACDLRKWVDATIYGMIGLSRTLDVLGARVDRDRIIQELRWGNAYFRKMQSADGYVMNYCGGDDGNRWTDNKVGSKDDRPIHVEPAELPAQFHFVAAQAAMSRHTREIDPAYATACESAARRCLKWCTEQRDAGAATSLAAAVMACAQLHRATGEAKFVNLAAGFLRKLLALQVTQNDSGVGGYFLAAPDRAEPSREIQHGNLPMLALCDAMEAFGKHEDSAKWRAALKIHAEHLVLLSDRSAFGTIPFGIYFGADPGGGRRIGSAWYRWTMKPQGEYAAKDWWVGINAHLASHGVGLCRAGRILQDLRLSGLGQRQLDWVLGANPFDVSTVTGAGRNQPKLYATNAFKPNTPLIAGGVMNGLGGTVADEICVDSGSYNTCEYWTPMVASTLWLMAELSG